MFDRITGIIAAVLGIAALAVAGMALHTASADAQHDTGATTSTVDTGAGAVTIMCPENWSPFTLTYDDGTSESYCELDPTN